MRSSVIAVLALALAAVAAAQAATPWEYEGKRGATAWGRLDPAYKLCSTGHEQSPIDIRNARLNTALQPIEFHYIAGPITVENNGHAIVVHVNRGSYMVVNGIRYELTEYDFHRPSETTVNGKLTDMEVQLLHKSADGKLAIIAIRMTEDIGNPNATLATIWEHLPRTAGSSNKITEMVNPGGLVPADRGYWSYTGSLTTPPCTEGVHWFVFEQELGLSRSQLRTFAALFKVNIRPMQEPHGRRIEANE